MDVEIRALGPGDDEAVLAAAELFDDPPQAEATARFLNEPTHHLLVAYDEAGQPLGFVSGVEITHPDKGTEMCLYELGVDEPWQRRGIATALVEALRAVAEDRGCGGMWVAVDPDNAAALATYARAGATAPQPAVILEWPSLPGSDIEA